MKIPFTTSLLVGALALSWSAAQAQTGSPGGTAAPSPGSSEAPGSFTPSPGTTTTPRPMPDPTVPDTTATPGAAGSSGRRTPGTGGTTGMGGNSAMPGDKGRLMDSPGGVSMADPTETDVKAAAETETDTETETPVEKTPTAQTEPVQVYTPPVAARPPVVRDRNRLTPLNRAVEPVPTPFDYPDPYQRRGWRKIGGAVLLGGGFEDFTNSSLQSMTGAGGAWNVRAVAGTYSIVGVEAAYIGSARNINALGLESNAALVGNGAEGALRLNVPMLQGYSLVEPFGFVGLGWARYNVVNTNTQSSAVAGRDDVMTMPAGGGLAFAYHGFIADARFTYRYTYQNDLMRTAGGRLNNWGLGAQVGYTF
jgi:hypothetical protein